ncbi:MAG: hypothetical protein RXR43_04150 [Sulfolobus sp.]
MRGRKVPNETPPVLEGSGYRSRRRHGEGNKGDEGERLNHETSMKVRTPVEYRDFTIFIIMVRECYHKINRINHGMYKWGEGEDDKNNGLIQALIIDLKGSDFIINREKIASTGRRMWRQLE